MSPYSFAHAHCTGQHLSCPTPEGCPFVCGLGSISAAVVLWDSEILGFPPVEQVSEVLGILQPGALPLVAAAPLGAHILQGLRAKIEKVYMMRNPHCGTQDPTCYSSVLFDCAL